jgi:hypothetical protein
MAAAKAMASKPNSSVVGTRSKNAESVFCLETKLSPKSPCTRFAMYRPNCW